MPHPEFDLQGHRGARGLAPENTLHGFALAARLGVRTMELDVGTTRDGAVVVHHDPALNPDMTRDANGDWLRGPGPLLRDLTLSQLQEYDVGRLQPGTPYAEMYASQAPHDGARIPTLDQVLALDATLRWNIELKLSPDRAGWTIPAEEMVERVLHVVDAAGAGPRVALQSFDWAAPRHVRRIRPGVAVGWLTDRRTMADAPVWLGRHLGGMSDVPDAVAREGGGTWAPHHHDLTEDLLDQAHDLALRVLPWTVNAVDDMRRLIDWGMDGLITDWPDRALLLLPLPPGEGVEILIPDDPAPRSRAAAIRYRPGPARAALDGERRGRHAPADRLGRGRPHHRLARPRAVAASPSPSGRGSG